MDAVSAKIVDSGNWKYQSPAEKARTSFEVDAFNKTLNEGKKSGQSLDKDDFLKILITQLQHQDPTSPMEDRDFIAQMAQFSSLEQMTNMSASFGKLSASLSSGEALSALGREVEVDTPNGVVRGVLSGVARGDKPLVTVNGEVYDFAQVSRVVESCAPGRPATAEAAPPAAQKGEAAIAAESADSGEGAEKAVAPTAAAAADAAEPDLAARASDGIRTRKAERAYAHSQTIDALE